MERASKSEKNIPGNNNWFAWHERAAESPEQEWEALSKGTEMVWLNKKGAAGTPGYKYKELPE